MFDRQVQRSQGRIVMIIRSAGSRRSGDHFGDQHVWLNDMISSRSSEVDIVRQCLEVFSIVDECFIITAGRERVTVAGREALRQIATLGRREEGNVPDLTHAQMHTNHKAGRRNQHQKGQHDRCYSSECFH